MPEAEAAPDAVTCTRCGRVGFAVSRAESEQRIARHNRMRLESPENRQFWTGPTSLDSYRCLGCGGWGPYRPARPGNCPSGMTINLVVTDME